MGFHLSPSYHLSKVDIQPRSREQGVPLLVRRCVFREIDEEPSRFKLLVKFVPSVPFILGFLANRGPLYFLRALRRLLYMADCNLPTPEGLVRPGTRSIHLFRQT